MRVLLSRFGGTGTGGAGLLSYLLFDTQFCGALIELGYADAQKKKDDLLALMA